MNLLKISNCYFTKRAFHAISRMIASIPASKSVLPTPPVTLSTPCAVRGLDGQHFSCRSDSELLRTHEKRPEDAEELAYASYDVEALRERLYQTNLKLLATQLACKKLAFSVRSSAFRLLRTNTGLREDLFDLPQRVQPAIGPQTIWNNRSANSLVCSRLLNKPSPSASRIKNPPSGSRHICVTVNVRHNAKASLNASEDDGVKQLMIAAHNGDLAARRKCRDLIRIAENTPNPQRSTTQKLLLNEWRKPPREIFVDASGYGIGVVLDDKWLAWKFVVDHPNLRKGPDGRIDSTWAELTAAEMGVRTLLAANYGYLPVSFRSDNIAVVDALKARQWKKNSGLDGIVQEIVDLCDRDGLHLLLDWVDSKANSADKPSRGKYPPRERTFYCHPPIPSHLSELIHQVDCGE